MSKNDIKISNIIERIPPSATICITTDTSLWVWNVSISSDCIIVEVADFQLIVALDKALTKFEKKVELMGYK